MNIEIKNIRKKYGKKEVLKGVDLKAAKGECIGILGGNGSGKSTLLTILAGIQSCSGGSFLIDGEDLFKNQKELSRLVGYVPQGTPLIEELNAYDNLLLWYSREEMKKELSGGILKLLGIDEFLKTRVSKMSGGMKKRLSIGCSISKKPPVLLLDEPMSALDLQCKQKIYQYIRSHKATGGTLLIATHDVLERELCDRWYIMKDGRLNEFKYNGNIEELVKSL